MNDYESIQCEKKSKWTYKGLVFNFVTWLFAVTMRYER